MARRLRNQRPDSAEKINNRSRAAQNCLLHGLPRLGERGTSEGKTWVSAGSLLLRDAFANDLKDV